MIGIAAELGIALFKKDLGQNVSGLIRRDEEMGGTSGYVIIVHNGHHLHRQRFTVAHEIAHYALHCGKIDGEIKDDEFYRALPGPLEREANEMAADILMPWSLINQLSDRGIRDLGEMARRLQVSRQSLAIRLGLPYDQDWG